MAATPMPTTSRAETLDQAARRVLGEWFGGSTTRATASGRVPSLSPPSATSRAPSALRRALVGLLRKAVRQLPEGADGAADGDVERRLTAESVQLEQMPGGR